MSSFPVEIPTARCWAGDTTILGAVTLYEGPVADGVRLSLHDWSNWRAQWRPKKTSKKVVDLDVEVNPSQGTIIVRALPDQTNSMGMSGYWDVQSEDANEVRTWLWGKTKWDLDVTR